MYNKINKEILVFKIKIKINFIRIIRHINYGDLATLSPLQMYILHTNRVPYLKDRNCLAK